MKTKKSILGSAAFAASQDSMQHSDMQGKPQSVMQGDKAGMPMMQDGKMGMPMMKDGKMDMPMMQGMMGNMMGDMKDGKMMDGMMKGCMMQSAMNESMRQNKTFSDKAFLSAMIPHHEAAVEMANAVLKNGKDAQVKKWAEAVITDQQAEIKQMREWLTAMGGEDTKAAGMMKDSMHSMMTMPMNQDPDINFVSMMIGHHASAVEMAVSAVLASKDENIIKLGNTIARAQLDEITAYRAWLKAKGQ